MTSMATTQYEDRSSSHTKFESQLPSITMDYRTKAEFDDAGSVVTVDSSYSLRPGDNDCDRYSHSSRLDSSDCECNSDHDDHGDLKKLTKPRRIEINGCKYHPNLPCECINTIIEVDTESNWSFKHKQTDLEDKECGCNMECDCNTPIEVDDDTESNNDPYALRTKTCGCNMKCDCDTPIEVDDDTESNNYLWNLRTKACGCNMECDCEKIIEDDDDDDDDDSVYTDSNWSYHPGRDKACECNLECVCDTQSNWSFKIGDDKNCGCNLPCDCARSIKVDTSYILISQEEQYGRAALYLRRASGVSVHLPEPKKYEPGLQDDWDESIEADDSDESDSDESDSSGAESLGSSIYEYLFEHGRRYHSYFGENKNLIPIDERENERQNLHHEAFRVLLDNRLHLTPLKTPARILDIGCGAGKWAIDMAEKYPDCEVVGVDLSPIQPTTVPKNLTFVVHDVERRWTFGENKFDFIHIRNLAQGISNWKYVISRAYAALKPGGFIELSELETTANCDDNGGLPDNDEIKIFMDKLNSALLKLGRSPATKESMINHLMTTDFINVEATTFKHPFGPWSKDEKLKKVGAMNEEDCGTMFTAYGLAAFTRVLEMDICDAVEICQDAGYAEGRTYSNFHVVYAQKPTAG